MSTLTCTRCGRQAAALDRAPLHGKLGQDVQSSVCPDCWREWTAESFRLINHLGLQPINPADRQRLHGLMREFLKMPVEAS